MNPVHIMVDLETWGTTPGSDLRSIGAIVFDPIAGTLGETFYVNTCNGARYGLFRDSDTEKWWADQSQAAQSVLEEHSTDLALAFGCFSDWWIEQQGGPATRDHYARFWANGSHFDFVLLEAAYRAMGQKVPWIYRAPRDCKTAWDMAGGVDLPFEGVEHNALDDARHQARCVIEAYKNVRAASWIRDR